MRGLPKIALDAAVLTVTIIVAIVFLGDFLNG